MELLAHNRTGSNPSGWPSFGISAGNDNIIFEMLFLTAPFYPLTSLIGCKSKHKILSTKTENKTFLGKVNYGLTLSLPVK
jgi:hypothetical protein